MKKQTESTLTVLLVEPEKKPRVVTIPHTLEEMQKLVGGHIECIQPFTDDEVALISNEEGKLLGLPLNRAIFWKDSTEPFDIIAGTFFIVGAPSDSEEFESLPEDKLETYAKRFAHPECFFKAFGKLHIIPME